MSHMTERLTNSTKQTTDRKTTHLTEPHKQTNKWLIRHTPGWTADPPEQTTRSSKRLSNQTSIWFINPQRVCWFCFIWCSVWVAVTWSVWLALSWSRRWSPPSSWWRFCLSSSRRPRTSEAEPSPARPAWETATSRRSAPSSARSDETYIIIHHLIY